jgi:hypothetical protein
MMPPSMVLSSESLYPQESLVKESPLKALTVWFCAETLFWRIEVLAPLRPPYIVSLQTSCDT